MKKGVSSARLLPRNVSHLEPEVVLGLVRHLAVVVADVALSDQAVDGPLVGVGAVPQCPAVVQAELVLRRWREAWVERGETDERGARCARGDAFPRALRAHRLSWLFMYSWNQFLKSPSWCCTLFTTCMAAFRSPHRRQ